MRAAAHRPFLVAVALLIAVLPGQAQNRGVYPLGMSATASGVTPAPGFTYANQLLFYSRDRAKDDEGNTTATGANAVLMDMNTFAWVSNLRLLGARYSASATLPIARNSLTSDVTGPISGGSGFADSYYLPLILGWTGKRAAARAMYGFLAPTGSFVEAANDNVGSGYWTHAFSSGQTFYLTENRRLVLSTFEMYEVHTMQNHTRVQPGDTLDVDYSLLASLTSRETVQVQAGLAGYHARQTTAKTGPNVTAVASEERYAVNSLGFALTAAFPKARASLGLKYFKEYANRSTFEGYSLQVQGAMSF
jgi:hypothetical protein